MKGKPAEGNMKFPGAPVVYCSSKNQEILVRRRTTRDIPMLLGTATKTGPRKAAGSYLLNSRSTPTRFNRGASFYLTAPARNVSR